MATVERDPASQWGRYTRVLLRVEDLAERWGCTFWEAKLIAMEVGEPEFILPDGEYLFAEDDVAFNFDRFIGVELAEKRFEDARVKMIQMQIDFMQEQIDQIASGFDAAQRERCLAMEASRADSLSARL